MDRFALAVLSGLVCGAVGGVVVVVVRPPPELASEDGSTPDPDGEVERIRRDEPRRDRRRRDRSGSSTTELGIALSSPDEAVRHAALRDVMAKGRKGLRQLERARPPTAEGQRLVALAHPALDDLIRNREHPTHARLPAVSKLELELNALSRILPDSAIRPERLAYWTERVAVLERLRESGGGQPGELALARIERDRVRMELGEVSADAWREVVESGRPDVDAWIDGLADRRDVAPARVTRLRELVGGIERSLERLESR